MKADVVITLTSLMQICAQKFLYFFWKMTTKVKQEKRDLRKMRKHQIEHLVVEELPRVLQELNNANHRHT